MSPPRRTRARRGSCAASAAPRPWCAPSRERRGSRPCRGSAAGPAPRPTTGWCSLGSGRSALATISHDGRLHRELTAAAGDDLAGHADVVADVDERLVLGEGLLADLGQRQHRLQLGAVALAQPHEAAASRCCAVWITRPTTETVSPVRVSGSSPARRRSARTSVSVWVRRTTPGYARPTGLDHPLALLPPDLHLLGKVVLDGSAGWSVMGSSLGVPRVKTISSPRRVSQGSWSVTVRHSATTSGARPPVATTFTSPG